MSLVFVYQSGGLSGTVKQKIIYKENLGLLWANFVSKTRFAEIPEGVEVINPGKTVAPNMQKYKVVADKRAITYDDGKPFSDQRFHIVKDFVTYVMSINLNK